MGREGVENRVGKRGWREGDLLLIGGPFFTGLVVGMLLLSPHVGLWGLILAPLFGLVGIAAVSAAPKHLAGWEWLKLAWRDAKRPDTLYSASRNAPGHMRNEGGLANSTPFKPDERTEDLLGVKRAWPGTGAVLRTDGLMETFIEIIPPNMDFATPDEWRSLQENAQQFANKSMCEYGGTPKIYATTNEFDIDSVINRLEERRNDADIRERPVMRALLDEYLQARPGQMRDAGMQEVRFFLAVQVEAEEVATTHHGEPEPREKLYRTPLIGHLMDLVGLVKKDIQPTSESLTEHEIREQMFEKLEERLDDVEQSFIEGSPGYSAERLTTIEVFALGARFWNADDQVFNNLEHTLRESPAIHTNPFERRRDG